MGMQNRGHEKANIETQGNVGWGVGKGQHRLYVAEGKAPPRVTVEAKQRGYTYGTNGWVKR